MRFLRTNWPHWRLLLEKENIPLCAFGELISRVEFDSLGAAKFAIACFAAHGVEFELDDRQTNYTRGIASHVSKRLHIDIWAAHPDIISGWPLYQIDFMWSKGLFRDDVQYQCHAVSLPIMAGRIAEGIKKEPPVIPGAPDIRSSSYV